MLFAESLSLGDHEIILVFISLVLNIEPYFPYVREVRMLKKYIFYAFGNKLTFFNFLTSF